MAQRVIGRISLVPATEKGISSAADEMKYMAGEYLRHVSGERFIEVLVTVGCPDNDEDDDE
jgi:hypothetical protein